VSDAAFRPGDKVVVTEPMHHLRGEKGEIAMGGWTRLADGSLKSIDHRDLALDTEDFAAESRAEVTKPKGSKR